MERHNLGKERLIVPSDFTSAALSRNVKKDLIPPSHFTSTVHPAGTHRSSKVQEASPPTFINSGLTSAPSGSSNPENPWLAISQAQQEILELRRENQRLVMSQRENRGVGFAVDHPSDLRIRKCEQWSRWESEWHLEAEEYKAEAIRLKGQVEALKESAERQRDEMKDRDSTLNRQSHELEAMSNKLHEAEIGLYKIRKELSEMSAEKEKISSQFERLKGESDEEITKLRRALERSEEDSRELVLKAEMGRLQVEEEAKQQTLKLSEQLKELRMKQEVELQRLNVSHHVELDAVSKTNRELNDKLQSMTSEVLQQKNNLVEISTERDRLKEHLSQMGQAFETQSATLHSLRNYIGQLAPEKGEKERLNDAVERLNKEKEALQRTTELLTVRLNCVNEILALQEEKMTFKDPITKNELEGLQVLRLWREKVFKLCIQLRLKDIELKGEKDELLSKLRAIEQQLQQEQHRGSVLQHSLDNTRAELDLKRVEKETLKMDLAGAHKELSQLKSQNQKAEVDLQTVSEAMQSFTAAFQSKVAEVDAAQTRLNTFTQRLTFAKGRVETIQGLIMRRVALQKVQQASKQAEHAIDSITNLQMELSLVRDERDKLTQELKRTPELIMKALADLKEQYEGKVEQQQQELEQSWMEACQAVSGREEAERKLQEIQAQLKESEINLETLRSELLSQQEHSERVLQERVSEIKNHCAEKLREMEDQVNTARREHTKAVMTLRQFEKEAVKKQDEIRRTRHYESQLTKNKVQNKQPKEMMKDNLLLASVAGGRLKCDDTRAHTAAIRNPSAPREHPGKHSDKHADARLLSVLEELHSLSAAVVNSSEDSAEEEEGQTDSVGLSTGSLTADT
ncbi:coiled-coil alpha-helical rod protein 1 isoform X2 [Cheilinus undulatus]|uniref:coiled-coil alpha-helical rod protein 1 isoform X2 n=1 Tax=Cheilinus undulatus TaxID=241271 RepID=UPI001BD61A8C|nr:coiled-coil alpha-helical rod protein 1 isoform X2 [Cheilinus undulatus]